MTENRTLRFIAVLSALAGAVLCALFSLKSALVTLASSAVIIGLYEYASHRKNQRLMRICDDIDRILRGMDSVDFSDYNEGEVSILAAEVHKMTIRLREQNAALSDEKKFLKESLEDIAHQLRTPLTSMMLIIETPDTGSYRQERTQELYMLLSRMNWLIDTMLGLSRIDAGVVLFRRVSLDCRSLIEEAMAPLLISMDIKGIEAEVKTEGNPSLVGDSHYLAEALVNILKNCIEHTPEGGKITITAQENPIYTGIVIEDSGKGFSQEELPHLFERFYRSGNCGKDGYGIGLAFARRIVCSLGGSLRAENSPDGGALFDLRIYKSSV